MSGEVRTPQPLDLKSFLNKHIGAIKSVSESTLTPEKMVRLVCAATLRQPDLALCTPLSILQSMMSAATYDLGVCDGSNEGYLVPYNCKIKGPDGRERWEKQAQFIPGYQGLVKKAVESGKVRNIESRVVYVKDLFDYELGVCPTIKHKPHLGADRGEILAVYAVAFLPDGSTQFEVMAKDEIDAIKSRGKEKKFSPWESDYSEMARKTVVRRLYKYIPKSKVMSALLEIQAKSELGEFVDGEVLRPGDANVSSNPIKALNDDGDKVFHWSDEDREEAKAILGTHMDTLLDSNTSEEDINTIADEYKALIGHPDISKHVWNNRLDGKIQRTIDKQEKK